MQTIFFDNTTQLHSSAVATVGFFDGVHQGHRYLIDKLKGIAREQGLVSMVVTFDKHPRQVLHSDYQPMLLSTLDEKLDALEETGVDICVVIPFTTSFASLSAHDFMEKILKGHLSVNCLLTGYDNRFGCRREDGYENYVVYGREMGMTVVDADSFRSGVGNVSSSVVRRLIADGNVEGASECLGRPYRLSGTVVHGEAKGRTMGFPTANIRIENTMKIIPKNGVYAVRAWVSGSEKAFLGMMNIGNRPTFGGLSTTLEVNILDFEGSLYGEKISVDFVKRLRNEVLFDSKEALAEQLRRDENDVRTMMK